VSGQLVIIATDNLSVQLACLHGAFHCGFVVAFPRLLLFICWFALEVVALLWLSTDLLARWSRISKPQCIVTLPMLMVYITVMLSYVPASNCSLKRMNLWFLFVRWFPHGRALLTKKLPDKITYKVWYIIEVWCTWYNSFFIQLEARQDNWKYWCVETNRSWSWTRSHEKRKFRSQSHTQENQQLGIWSRSRIHVHENKNSGAGSVSFIQRLHSPVCKHRFFIFLA